MRSIVRYASVTIGAMLVCVAGTARADSTPIVEANVPFPFVVNGESFPAGKYVIERDDTSSSIVVVRGETNNGAAAFVMTMPDGRRDPAGARPVLAFDRFENQYRLKSIWQSANDGLDVVTR